MSSQTYHIKIRGRALGPYTVQRLMQMAREGSLNKMHQVSEDGKNWQSASNFPEFFSEPVSAKKTTQESVVQNQNQPSSGYGLAPEPVDDPIVDQMPEEMIWHYGINDQSTGPVSRGMIEQLIKSGQLSQDDMLWRPGMDDWQPVRNHREFARLVAKGSGKRVSELKSSRSRTSDDYSDRSDSGGFHSARLPDLLRSSRPWVYITCISLYLIAAINICFFSLVIIQSLRFLILPGIFVGLAANFNWILVAVAGFHLNMYGARIGRYLNTNDEAELCHANRSLKWFWIFTAILGILWFLAFSLSFLMAIISLIYSDFNPEFRF
jgi:hypothetical protein